MRPAGLVVLLAALAAACAPARVNATSVASPVILAVVTWNVHAGRGDLPRLVADLEAGRLTPDRPVDFVVLL